MRIKTKKNKKALTCNNLARRSRSGRRNDDVSSSLRAVSTLSLSISRQDSELHNRGSPPVFQSQTATTVGEGGCEREPLPLVLLAHDHISSSERIISRRCFCTLSVSLFSLPVYASVHPPWKLMCSCCLCARDWFWSGSCGIHRIGVSELVCFERWGSMTRDLAVCCGLFFHLLHLLLLTWLAVFIWCLRAVDLLLVPRWNCWSVMLDVVVVSMIPA